MLVAYIPAVWTHHWASRNMLLIFLQCDWKWGTLGLIIRRRFIHVVLAAVLEQGSNSPEATSYDPVFYYNRIVASFVHSVVKATSAFTFHSYDHHPGCSEYNSVPVHSLGGSSFAGGLKGKNISIWHLDSACSRSLTRSFFQDTIEEGGILSAFPSRQADHVEVTKDERTKEPDSI